MRQAVARGRRRRVRGDRLPRVLRPRGDRARGRARELLQVPGERNEMRYAPRGVAAVISPWNFPLAIPCGMTAGALATGNSVVLKPAEQSPGCALMLVQALRAGGVPASAISLLPGEGDVGAALVAHPRVQTIAFTGSLPVGLEITRAAGIVAPGQQPHQARGRRTGRQELRDRRLRRRSRRGGPGHRRLGLRLRRAEVLGGGSGPGPRGDRRSADRARGRGGAGAGGGSGRASWAPTSRR